MVGRGARFPVAPSKGHSRPRLGRNNPGHGGQVTSAGVLAGQVYEKDSVMGQAMELGMLSTLGLDIDLSARFADNLEAVTAEDVQRVAQQWLVPERLTVGTVKPKAPTSDQPQAEPQP